MKVTGEHMKLDNPWKNLDFWNSEDFVHSTDRDYVKDMANVESKKRIILTAPPVPYIGNPKAMLVFLNLNPGYNIDKEYNEQQYYDRSDERNHEYLECYRKNLLHENYEYPFFCLDPKFEEGYGSSKKKDFPGYGWWNNRMEQLLGNEYDHKAVSRKIFCIEYFPYHSTSSPDFSRHIPTREYNFQLLDEAIARKATIILMQGPQYWKKRLHDAHGAPYSYYRTIFRHNLTKDNLVFDDRRDALREIRKLLENQGDV